MAVTDLTVVHNRRSRLVEQAPISRHVLVVTVSEVTRPTLVALDYAKQLQPNRLHCVHVEVDDQQRDRVQAAWLEKDLEPELEIIQSP